MHRSIAPTTYKRSALPSATAFQLSVTSTLNEKEVALDFASVNARPSIDPPGVAYMVKLDLDGGAGKDERGSVKLIFGHASALDT